MLWLRRNKRKESSVASVALCAIGSSNFTIREVHSLVHPRMSVWVPFLLLDDLLDVVPLRWVRGANCGFEACLNQLGMWRIWNCDPHPNIYGSIPLTSSKAPNATMSKPLSLSVKDAPTTALVH
eukprot:scaffold41124_cov54-Attheya_sp.AAC.1